MFLDKFKNIKAPDIEFSPDRGYIDALNALPHEKRKKPILSIVGTVAAALAVIVGVSAWALIGRGVRNMGDGTKITAGADDYSSYTELEIKNSIGRFDAWSFFFVKNLPLFDNEHKPSMTELTIWFTQVDRNNDGFMPYVYDDFSRETFEKAIEQYFGFTPKTDPNRVRYLYSVDDEEIDVTLNKAFTRESTDGKSEFVYIYTRNDVQYRLEIISEEFLKEPIRYLSHTKVGKPLEKDYSADYIYDIIKERIMTDERVTYVDFYFRDIQKISDTRYFYEPFIIDLEVTDPSRYQKISNDVHRMLNELVYIDVKDGEYVISDYQPNAYVPNYDKTSITSKFIIKHGLVEMPEFESEMIAASDTQAQSEDIDFILFMHGSFPEPNADGYYACEISYEYDDKLYYVGFLTKINPEANTEEITADYFVYKKELGSRTGKELEAYR